MNAAPIPAIETVENAFRWFNKVGSRKTALRREDVARHFHPETRIRIDNVMKGVGVDGLHARFEEMLEKLEQWEVPLPFHPSLSQDERAAAYYEYCYKDKQGGQGKISIIAIWTVAEGKVLETLENAVYAGDALDLASHS